MSPCPDPTTHTTPHDDGDTAVLREKLADDVRALRRVPARDDRVDTALRAVSRHRFLPGVELTEAYSPRPVVTRRGPDGGSTSSASAPVLVAEMLEMAELRPGHHVLEIGAATGFNAALLAHLTGPDGAVTTVELDNSLAVGARKALDHAGHPEVEVIAGDGALGAPDRAPFDRIIVTAATREVPAPWWQQLTDHGHVVMPLQLHRSGLTRLIAAHRDGPDRLVASTALVCGFITMRGLTGHDTNVLDLGDGVSLALGDLPHPSALAEVLRHPAEQRWSGIHTRDDQPVEHLDLWLLAHADRPFARLQATRQARAAGRAAPPADGAAPRSTTAKPPWPTSAPATSTPPTETPRSSASPLTARSAPGSPTCSPSFCTAGTTTTDRTRRCSP